VADVPRVPSPDLPRAGPPGQGPLAMELSGGAARRLIGADLEQDSGGKPDAGPTEQELVKSRVDSMFAEARAAQRAAGAVDGAVASMSRGFEQAARRGSFTPDLQRMVEAALERYRESARRFGRLGKDDSTDTWARIEDRALRGLDRSEATYVAVVELRQASDGSLRDLKLVVSSGAREFDARALGSVADGLKADATAFLAPRPEGTLLAVGAARAPADGQRGPQGRAEGVPLRAARRGGPQAHPSSTLRARGPQGSTALQARLLAVY
jgi:hypothetical protein